MRGGKCQNNDGEERFWCKFWFEMTQIFLNDETGKEYDFLLKINQNETSFLHKPHAGKNAY